MRLETLLEGVPVLEASVDMGLEITGVSYDSRQVRPGDLFVAMTGFAADGHRFIPQALEAGAAAVLCQNPPEGEGIPYVRTEDSRRALAAAGANFFGHPAEAMTMVGITGTNGKTTTTYLLKAILEAQKQSVTLEVDGLGLFTLNRRVRWFEAEIDWCGASVQLDFDQGEPEEMAKAQEVARTLLADAENWDRRVREYAAGELTSLANDWAEGEEELTPEDFMARMELSAIQVEPDGEFEFWFEDGEMFYGHSIHVMGNLTDGPDWAQMEG